MSSSSKKNGSHNVISSKDAITLKASKASMRNVTILKTLWSDLLDEDPDENVDPDQDNICAHGNENNLEERVVTFK